MKNVALHNLGCKVNSYELDVVQQILQEKGYKIVPFDESADIYIVNTCTVTNIADRKSRQMLHRAKKRNPNAIVVAIGCYVQTAGEKIEKDDAIDIAIGNHRKKDIAAILDEYMEGAESESHAGSNYQQIEIIDMNQTQEYEPLTLEKTAEHTRVYIKIQDGCNQFCSYCIIPFARGRVRSRKQIDIMKEVEILAGKGYKEIVLTGIHISSYGTDFEKRTSLLELVKAVHQVSGIERIRLGSLEPRIITREFVTGLLALPKICPHFHLSLQSGCDTVLKRMNRKYTAEEFYEKVCLLREAFKSPAITTDVIVGFPGETEEEFAETKAFIKKIEFFEMHIFPYSKREGTVAAKMEGQLSEQTKKERVHLLLQIEKEQSEVYRKRFCRKEVEVLFEESIEITGKTYQIGHTREYIKVAKESDKDLTNCVCYERTREMLTKEILLI